MTEEEWLVCSDPRSLVWNLRDRASNRKLRLLATSCWRRAWAALTDQDRRAIEIAEHYTEGSVSTEDMARISEGNAEPYCGPISRISAEPACSILTSLDDAQWVAEMSVENSEAVVAALAEDEAMAWKAESYAQVHLTREIFGNPFRLVSFLPAWRTDTALTLARQMYDSRDFSAMPILADALQDAGCDSEDLLNHLRDTTATHVRGCWALDLVLGKE